MNNRHLDHHRPLERRAAPQPPAHDAPHEPTPGDLFGLRSAVDSVLRHGGLALSVFGLVMGAAVLYALLMPPVYKADTLVRIDSRVKDSLAPNLGPAQDRSGTELARHNVAGEMEILTSREVLLPVMASVGADIEVGMGYRHGYLPVGSRHGITVPRLQLPASQHGKSFKLTVNAGQWTLVDAKANAVAQGLVGVVTPFAIAGGEGRIEVQAPAPHPMTRLAVKQLPPLRAYEDVIRRLRILELARESGVLRLTFEDTSAHKSAALLNRLVHTYLEHTVARKAGDGAQALRFVEAQLPAVKTRLDAAEMALVGYQQNNRAAPLNTEAEALLRQRTDLERQAVELQVKRDQLAEHLTPAHPELAAVMRQLGTVQAALGRVAGQADRLPEQSREVMRLQREVATQTQLYSATLAHVQQLRVADSGWLANAKQLDRAMTPIEATRPRPAAVLSVGAGLGFVLALLATLAAHALQPTVTGTRELIARVVPPTLAVIPESAAQKRLMSGRIGDRPNDRNGEHLADGSLEELGTHRLLARTVPDDPAVESLRTVHMGLMLRERQMATKVILVTAPTTGTGKTFVAANLAAVMAETGRRVLLMEADLHKPGLHHIVSIDEMAPGLTDLLAGARGLDQVILRHPSAGFDVLLQGSRTRKLGALLMSPALEETIAQLRLRYDHIVINGAPTLPTRDALVVGRLADLALLVVRAEQSLLGETRAALRQLQQGGVKLEGLLFNGVKRNRLNAPVVT